MPLTLLVDDGAGLAAGIALLLAGVAAGAVFLLPRIAFKRTDDG